MKKITLRLDGDTWIASSDDHLPLFGTRDIPTAFTAFMPAEEVCSRIRELNPEAVVEIWR